MIIEPLRHWATFIECLSHRHVPGVPNFGFAEAYKKSLLGRKLTSITQASQTPAFKALGDFGAAFQRGIEERFGSDVHAEQRYEMLRSLQQSQDISMHELKQVLLFQRNGSNVFNPSASLTKMFLETEVNFPMSSMKVPYPAFFVKLPVGDYGLDTPTPLGPKRVEGFYTSWTWEDRTEIRKTAHELVLLPGNQVVERRGWESIVAREVPNPDKRSYFLSCAKPLPDYMTSDGYVCNILTVARDGVTNDHEDFTVQYYNFCLPHYEADTTWEDILEREGQEQHVNKELALLLFSKCSTPLQKIDTMFIRLGRLVFNIALYINQAPTEPFRDVDRVMEPHLAQWLQDKSRKPTSQLGSSYATMMKHGPVNEIKLGHRLEAQLLTQRRAVEDDAAKRSVVCHWRRGHWHRYWVGPRDSADRVLTPRWIQPILVAGDETPTEHVYSISQPSDRE